MELLWLLLLLLLLLPLIGNWKAFFFFLGLVC